MKNEILSTRQTILILFVAGIILCCSTLWQDLKKGGDVAIYQCYAVAFWQGQSGLQSLPREQCSFLDEKSMLIEAMKSVKKYHAPQWIIGTAQYQNDTTQFHALPREYPVLSLFVFSLPLIAPPQLYQYVYAILAMLLVILLYFLIKYESSDRHALLFLACIIAAGGSTALGRFDLFPAALTLIALLMAKRGKWALAYVCIAIGVLLKFYPVMLLPVFLIAEQKSSAERWYAFWRWKAFLVGFGAVFVSGIFISCAISIPGTLGAFKYFKGRPLEIESLPAAFVWLGHFVGIPYQHVYAYVSMNVVSSISEVISTSSTVILVTGLLWIFWLQWRDKIDGGLASLVIIALVLATSKILSPQYLLWIIPLVAYVGNPTRQWVALWGTVMVLTFFIYPVVYNWGSPPPEIIFPLSLIRGLILLGFAGAVCLQKTNIIERGIM